MNVNGSWPCGFTLFWPPQHCTCPRGPRWGRHEEPCPKAPKRPTEENA